MCWVVNPTMISKICQCFSKIYIYSFYIFNLSFRCLIPYLQDMLCLFDETETILQKRDCSITAFNKHPFHCAVILSYFYLRAWHAARGRYTCIRYKHGSLYAMPIYQIVRNCVVQQTKEFKSDMLDIWQALRVSNGILNGYVFQARACVIVQWAQWML